MNELTRKKLKAIDYLAAIFFLVLMGIIYYGFFKPHPTIFIGSGAVKYIMLFIKIIFPMITLGILTLYFGVRTGKVSKSSVLLLFITLIIFSIISYPVADYFYKQRYNVDSTVYNTYLQRNPFIPSEIDTSSFNVFCLGGSTTEFKDTKGRDWPGLVEKTLKEKYGVKNIKFYNMGKAWYTTLHILINYTQNLRQLNPDMIIIMENINDSWHNADFSRFSNGKFRRDYGHYLGPEAFMIKSPNVLSYLWDSFRLLWYSDDIKEVDTKVFPGIHSFEQNLNTIIDLAQMDETEVLMMTQPHLYKYNIQNQELELLGMLNKEAIGDGKRWSYSSALSAITLYNNKIKEVADYRLVKFIDLEKIIPKTKEYFYDDVHYQDKTYDIISDTISSYFFTNMPMN